MSFTDVRSGAEPPAALSLSQVFGFSKDSHGSVHDLTDDNRKAIFYVAGNTGVIYDYTTGSQKVLQGHLNIISCCAVSPDKRWIVTGDRGDECMIVVWDSYSGIPIKTIFDPFDGAGVLSIDISADSMYVAAISDAIPQVFAVYEWTVEHDETETENEEESPDPTVDPSLILREVIPAGKSASSVEGAGSSGELADLQSIVRFNPSDARLLLTNSASRVIFWNWRSGVLAHHSPLIRSSDVRHCVGKFTTSVFIPGTPHALTATTDGEVVLWSVVPQSITDDDDNAVPDPASVGAFGTTEDVDNDSVREHIKCAVKSVHLHSSPVTVLTTVAGRYIVTGAEDGHIRFYDTLLRIVAWYEDICEGPVTSISFSATIDRTQFPEVEEPEGKPNEEVEEPFVVPNFVVGTSEGVVAGVDASTFVRMSPDERSGTVLLRGHHSFVSDLATHPKRSEIAVCDHSGAVLIIDYQESVVKQRVVFPGKATAVIYDKQGKMLAVGFQSGMVKIVFSDSLDEVASFEYTKCPIRMLRFSPDGVFLVSANDNHSIGMYKHTHRDEDKRKPIEWVFVGHHNSHRAEIVCLDFYYSLRDTYDSEEESFSDDAFDGATPRTPVYEAALELCTISSDRKMVEFDLDMSTISGGVAVKSVTKLDQVARPTAATVIPKSGNEFDLVFSNSEYKIRTFFLTHHLNRVQKVCAKTVLGPTHSGPIVGLYPIPCEDGSFDSMGLMAYRTANKVIGLMRWPGDGAPDMHMGLVAHSNEVASMAVSHDGAYVFAAGGSDYTVSMWSVNAEFFDEVESQRPQLPNDADVLLRKANEAGSLNIVPFLSLLEGGLYGEFMKEIIDYFYYVQLRSLPANAPADRRSKPVRVSGEIGVADVATMCRALGFYPSEQDIDNMVNDFHYEYGETTHTMNFAQFLKLYLNHRPVFQISQEDLQVAFDELGTDDVTRTLHVEQLVSKLRRSAEKMPDDELRRCLKLLLGSDVVETAIQQRSAQETEEREEDAVSSGVRLWVDVLGEDVPTATVARNVLGFDEYEERQPCADDLAATLAGIRGL